MAKCRNCGTDIPEGAEYCEKCLSELNTAKDSESYLDSLLNAVMTEEPERREIVYPKKEASSLVSVSENEKTEPEEAAADDWMKEFAGEPEEATADDWMQEFVGEPEEAAADDWMKEFAGEPEEAAADDWMQEFVGGSAAAQEEEPEEPPMEDVFGTFFDPETDLPDLKNYSIFGDVDESTVDRMLAEDLGEIDPWKEETEAESLPEAMPEQDATKAESSPEAMPEQDAFSGSFVEENKIREDEIVEEEVPRSEIGDIEELFGVLEDERGADAPEEIQMKTPEIISAADFDDTADLFSGVVEAPEEEVPVSEFGDFADLFDGGEASEEEPVEEEVGASEFGDFADLFGGGDASAEPIEEATAGLAEQTMDDFADLFSGFDGEDSGLFEFGAKPQELDVAAEEPEAGAVPGNPMPSAGVEDAISEKSRKEKKKQGRLAALYHKLFDDVKVDPAKRKPQPTKEELEAKKKEKEEAKARSKEEKDALLAEKKEQEKQIKLEKLRVKKEAQAEKKARKLEEAKLLLEEMETTRINRAGASIVFIFFAMIAVLIVMGTSIFSYSLSIRNAEYEFNRDEYTLAYNEIYGLEIKNEDIVLYDRIMTVMYVQKQLNSYYNYYGMKDKPKALDSLLKGLQRYEKYIELAVDLDVDSDLDLVRKKILTEINASFSLTEQEAMEIIQSDSQAEYSKKVYDAVEGLK